MTIQELIIRTLYDVWETLIKVGLLRQKRAIVDRHNRIYYALEEGQFGCIKQLMAERLPQDIKDDVDEETAKRLKETQIMEVKNKKGKKKKVEVHG